MKGLESGANVQEACMLSTAQEMSAKQGQRQVFHNLSYRNTEEKDMCDYSRKKHFEGDDSQCKVGSFSK